MFFYVLCVSQNNKKLETKHVFSVFFILHFLEQKTVFKNCKLTGPSIFYILVFSQKKMEQMCSLCFLVF